MIFYLYKILMTLLQKIENNNKQILTLIQTKDGLLPKLMFNEINI